MPNYRTFSLSATCLFAALCVCLTLAPDIVYWIFDLEANTVSDVLALRAAMLFLGFATLAYLSRNEPRSSLRGTIALSLALPMAGLMAAGLYEFLRGSVGPGIWLAISVETAFLLAYLNIWRDSRS